eukprot:GHUV01012627.1.p1 GENE.GHUV01012627.1~~GHUV01012627.1.p1  ORF type:complete len:199 (+),score=70.56 GHUV01012627.1:48-599(+)
MNHASMSLAQQLGRKALQQGQVPRSVVRPGTSNSRSKVGRCNVATGPQRVAGAPKPVQLDMRNEGFDEGFAGPSKGLFTSTNPELRRVVPDSIGTRTKVKVVYTVLEAQYQSALTAAVKHINSTNKTVCFELVGYLLEELRDPSNYAAFQKDLTDANVFIGSLIFIEELAEKVSKPFLKFEPI